MSLCDVVAVSMMPIEMPIDNTTFFKTVVTMRLFATTTLCFTSLFAANAWVQPYPSLSVKPYSSSLSVKHQSLLLSNRQLTSVFKNTALKATDVVTYDDCDPYDPEGSEYCTNKEPIDGSMKRTLRLTTLFFLWYVLNVGYNIGNKSVLNALPIPWTAATVELFFGFPYVALLWMTGLRKAPKLSFDNIKTLSPSAFFLAATHVAGVISFGAGAISFTHILKATEPVWSALLLAGFFKEFLPLPVYLSLIPIIGGVGLASLKELSFSWLGFTAGTISAVTSATKAILSKKVLDGKPLGENLVSPSACLLQLVQSYSCSLLHIICLLFCRRQQICSPC